MSQITIDNIRFVVKLDGEEEKAYSRAASKVRNALYERANVSDVYEERNDVIEIYLLDRDYSAEEAQLAIDQTILVTRMVFKEFGVNI